MAFAEHSGHITSIAPNRPPSNRSLRVLFLSSCVQGGGVGRSLCVYFGHEGQEIDPAVVMPERGVIADKFPSNVDVHLVPEFVDRIQKGPYALPNRLGWPWLEFAGGVTAYLRSTSKVTEVARELQPDVIYCNHMIAKPVGAYVGSRLGIPVVFHARNVHVHPVGRRFYRFLAGLDETKLVIANSEASAEPYRGAGAEVVVVPNFVDLERFDPAKATPRLRQELGLRPDAVVIGYLGRLVPKKGIDVLIKAFALVHQRYPKAVLTLIGGNDDGSYRDMEAEYRELAASLGVADSTYFVGFQEDVPNWAIDLDINVLPSIEPESFGRVLIEAGSLGVPSVTSAHGGAMSVVKEGETGLLAAPGSVEALADALCELTGDDALRKQMGAAARADARANYDASRISSQITALLRWVAGERDQSAQQTLDRVLALQSG